MKKKITWSTEMRKVSELIPWDRNPRKKNDRGVKNLTESIDRFGMVDIIVIQPDGNIIGGHRRLEYLIEHGAEEAEVRVPSRKLSESEQRELAIRLNKNIAGDWDFQKLTDFDVNELVSWGFSASDFPQQGVEFSKDDIRDIESKIGIEQDGENTGEQTEDFEQSFKKIKSGKLNIVPRYCEHYSAFIIVCDNEIDEAWIREKLKLNEPVMDYKSSRAKKPSILSVSQLRSLFE
jgi:hypothetical protein